MIAIKGRRLYYSFKDYLLQRFSGRVWRISLDAGFSCPNRDGTLGKGGCVFCDNFAFSKAIKVGKDLEKQIQKIKAYLKQRFKADKFIAYFQPFTNTYASAGQLYSIYSLVNNYPDIVGIAISTRPDCIDQEKLKVINSFSSKYEVYLEYGLQSASDKTLKLINRNHTFNDFLKAVEMTAKFPKIKIATHIILGLPQETEKHMLDTAKKIANLPLWGIKFHCLHVIKGTELERWYQQGFCQLMEEEAYIDILIKFLERIPENWVILRLISNANPAMLLAPKWINDKQRILQHIEKELICRKTFQGRLFVK